MDKYYYCPSCGVAYHEELADNYDGKCKDCDVKLKLRSGEN
jgi:transcription initiation factor IIE alpha subunit